MCVQDDSVFAEENVEKSFRDDPNLSRTKEYTWIVQVLRMLENGLTRTIDVWDRFEAGDASYYLLPREDTRRIAWEQQLAAIHQDINELRFLRTTFQQKIEMFDSLKHSVSRLLYPSKASRC